jgi:metallophosphoesterase superfamily enzyme
LESDTPMRVHTDWLLTPERAAVHVPTATAVVADLHLGYDQARRRAGEAVPEVCLARVLAPLATVLARQGCARLVIAGDLFEADWCPRLAAEFRAWLDDIGVTLAGVIPGNHDRGLELANDLLPVCLNGVDVGGWRVVHGDGELPAGRLVYGHFHPWLRWGQVSAPCYLVGASSLVLPAFSADARGASVRRVHGWRSLRCCAIAGNEVLDIGELRDLRTPRKGTPLGVARFR